MARKRERKEELRGETGRRECELQKSEKAIVVGG